MTISRLVIIMSFFFLEAQVFKEFQEHTHTRKCLVFSFSLFSLLWWPHWIGLADFIERLYPSHIQHTHSSPLNLILASFEVRIFWSGCSAPPPSCRPTTQIFLLMYPGPLSFHTGIWSLDFESWALYHNLLYQGVLLSWYVGIERNGHVQTWLRSWWWPKVKPPGMEGGARKTQKKLERALWMDWMDRGGEIGQKLVGRYCPSREKLNFAKT